MRNKNYEDGTTVWIRYKAGAFLNKCLRIPRKLSIEDHRFTMSRVAGSGSACYDLAKKETYGYSGNSRGIGS